MSIIHVNHIKKYLHDAFSDSIDLSDVKTAHESEIERCFLTRSQAAFALTHYAGADHSDATAAITDGTHDNGIDALFYNTEEHTLYLVQSKWSSKGTGSIDSETALKVKKGFEDLINERFENFNDRIRALRPTIETAVENINTQYRILLVHTGTIELGDESQEILDQLKSDINDVSEVLLISPITQEHLHRIIATGTYGEPINLDVHLRHWGYVDDPYRAYYGEVNADDIARWLSDHHTKLFDPNIRSFLGNTEINTDVMATLRDQPEHFWYYNNGITVLCSTVQKKPKGTDRDIGEFSCSDVAIVNGAQTVGAISQAFSSYPEAVSKAKVMARFISLEDAPSTFAREVTRATNTQNRIGRKDFVSLDPEQSRLQTELRLEGIRYAYKSGEAVESDETGFDLAEATTARAVSQTSVDLAVQAKREVGKLWEDVEKPPYKRLFNPSVTGLCLWRTVQLVRAIDRTLSEWAAEMTGRDRLFVIHGNRFLQNEIIARLDLTDIDEPDFDLTRRIDQLPDIAARLIPEVAPMSAQLFGDSVYPAPLFKNRSKCQELSDNLPW